jgi:tetratricopeptide (TPR) repeat protein
MSQKPAPTVRPRVSTGIPWWIWLTLVVIGGAILLTIVTNAVPDDPEALFQAALIAADEKKVEPIMLAQEKLQAYPEYGDHLKLVEGILFLGRQRPLKAIKPLEDAAQNPKLRGKAMYYLANARAQAEDPRGAIEIFETILKENADAHQARESLAALSHRRLAYDVALEHLAVLIEKKHNPAKAYQARAGIRMELGNFAGAAEDFESSIREDANDPTNSQKAEKLVECYLELDQPEKAIAMEDQIDRPAMKSLLKAYDQLARNDLAGALATVENIQREAPTDEKAAILLGKVAVQQNKPEKLKDAMTHLNGVIYYSRNLRLYQTAAEVARAAGDQELAGLIQQNVDLLEPMQKDYYERLNRITKDPDNADELFQLAELAGSVGKPEVAMKIYESIRSFFPERSAESDLKRELLFQVRTQLVKTGDAPKFSMERQGPPDLLHPPSPPGLESPAFPTTDPPSTDPPATDPPGQP